MTLTQDEWLKTGDIGLVDDGGHWYSVGRIKVCMHPVPIGNPLKNEPGSAEKKRKQCIRSRNRIEHPAPPECCRCYCHSGQAVSDRCLQRVPLGLRTQVSN